MGCKQIMVIRIKGRGGGDGCPATISLEMPTGVMPDLVRQVP